MIRNFRHKGLKKFFERGDAGQVSAAYRNKISRILATLQAATIPEDLDLTGFRLHRLTGEYKNFWSVTVSANWRIIFRMEDGDVCDVDFLDYH
jgi:proteic killer suppression protein